MQLLPRLYDVSAGAVLVDGADVRDVDVASLRAAIAVVDDDPFLFSATVAENIAYARADATREEIELAARRAQAHDFIARLPEGYDTRVGERGLTLSGGQRQRVAIARAFLADPRILILDDATSSVDASTEQEIKQALREVMAGRTTFVIAHRLSTISLADTIVVLEDGAVAAAGDHDALLEQSELYREIVEKGLPDQVFLNRNAPDRRGGGAVTYGDRGRPRRHAPRRPAPAPARHAAAAGASCAGSWCCSRPTGRASCSCSSRCVAGTAASLAPAPLAKTAIDSGILKGDLQHARPRGRRLRRQRARRLGGDATRRPTSSAGSASARWPTCACRSSATCRRCRSASTSAARPACSSRA